MDLWGRLGVLAARPDRLLRSRPARPEARIRLMGLRGRWGLLDPWGLSDLSDLWGLWVR